eukprot:CAMPEP_0197580204 /NCGR_PEP_ID=MMETSP1326-20131121/4051_1 /TAXON_ID=1155430 /ORGANISM="Genus nov. species nov., Strain RCC2288" /LENGTH=48 /DNA_ID= /DNA_START= /DNA_END= /DNA_ORIENTATION=
MTIRTSLKLAQMLWVVGEFIRVFSIAAMFKKPANNEEVMKANKKFMSA